MITNKVMLAALAAMTVAMAFAIVPALIQSAAAVPAPKQDVEEKCDDPKFADRTSCPGASEDAASDKRDDVQTCEPRNKGQEKDCPEGSIILDPVNPPN